MEIPTHVFFEKLKALIGCPEPWGRFRDDPCFRRALLLYWREIARKHEVGWEMSYYSQLMAVMEKSEELIHRIESNTAYWRRPAIADYCERTRFIRDFRHLTPGEHDKHWVIYDTSDAQIIARTKNGPAKYFPRMRLELLENALYTAVRKSWRRIVETKPASFYVTFEKAAGASAGDMTQHVCFYLDYSTNLVHSRPLLRDEKPTGEQWLDDIDDDLWPDMTEFCEGAVIDEEIEI